MDDADLETSVIGDERYTNFGDGKNGTALSHLDNINICVTYSTHANIYIQ